MYSKLFALFALCASGAQQLDWSKDTPVDLIVITNPTIDVAKEPTAVYLAKYANLPAKSKIYFYCIGTETSTADSRMQYLEGMIKDQIESLGKMVNDYEIMKISDLVSDNQGWHQKKGRRRMILQTAPIDNLDENWSGLVLYGIAPSTVHNGIRSFRPIISHSAEKPKGGKEVIAAMSEHVISELEKLVERATPYDYVIQGNFQKAFNSNGEISKLAAGVLMKGAASGSSIDTGSSPRFTAGSLKFFGPKLREAIKLFGFKAAYGIATRGSSPTLSKVIHLMGAPCNDPALSEVEDADTIACRTRLENAIKDKPVGNYRGGNKYQAVEINWSASHTQQKFAEYFGKAKLAESKTWSDDDDQKTWPFIDGKTEKTYMQRAEEFLAAEKVDDGAKELRELWFQSAESQKLGLARILAATAEGLGDEPAKIRNLFSWKNDGNDDKLATAYGNFLPAEKPDFEMSPAYDVAAAAFAVEMINGNEENRRVTNPKGGDVHWYESDKSNRWPDKSVVAILGGRNNAFQASLRDAMNQLRRPQDSAPATISAASAANAVKTVEPAETIEESLESGSDIASGSEIDEKGEAPKEEGAEPKGNDKKEEGSAIDESTD